MSRLSQFLGKNEYIKERFLFLESTVWTVPVTGEYRITAIGAGGEGGRASGDTASLSSGGSTIIQTPKGTVTLSGGGPGKSGSGTYIDNGGDVTSTVPGIFGRKGGHGGYGGAFAGLGLEIIQGQYNSTVSAPPLLSRGSGRNGSHASAAQSSAGLGGGGGGSTNLTQGGSGGGGGGIVENQPILLTAGDTVTITIGASVSPFSNGLVIFDRY